MYDNNCKLYGVPSGIPLHTKATLQMPLSRGTKEAFINIYDILGNQVQSLPLQNGKRIIEVTLEGLNNGTYIYDITIDGLVMQRKRMVLIK